MRDYGQHGPRHGTGGSDRRGGGYPAYEYDNVGEWLYIKTTSDVDGALSGMFLGVVFDGDGVGITNAAGGGDVVSLVVLGGDTDDDVSISFGGVGDGSPFFLDGTSHLSCRLPHHFDFQQADGSGNSSELSLNTGDVSLSATGGIDIVSNDGSGISPFPVDFGVNSVQIAAGDATNYGTVVLEAFDNQATPAYTEFFAGYVDFNPNPYTYNGQTAQILGGQKFTVVGSDGSPIFQVLALEQGGTVHIKTGTTVHADL
jgi:hypothetical protein